MHRDKTGKTHRMHHTLAYISYIQSSRIYTHRCLHHGKSRSLLVVISGNRAHTYIYTKPLSRRRDYPRPLCVSLDRFYYICVYIHTPRKYLLMLRTVVCCQPSFSPFFISYFIFSIYVHACSALALFIIPFEL